MNSATELDIQRWTRRLRVAPILGTSIAIVALLGLALWLRGAGFYALPLSERVDHLDYTRLSPSRPVGKTYGMVGFGLLLFNLAYLLRRRFPHWPLGRMRVWLDVHVATGIAAAVFTAFHSAFQLRSLVAVVTASTLVLTVITGIIGRFFYAFAPRSGEDLDERLQALDALLPGASARLQQGLSEIVPSEPRPGSGVWRVIRMLPTWRREIEQRRHLVQTTYLALAAAANPSDLPYSDRVFRDVQRLCARQITAVAGRELLRAWRPWHRLCAMTAVAGVVLHVAVAIFYGYL